MIEDGRLLLIKRGRQPEAGLWAVPGGKVERGETLTATARREVREETGLEIEVGDVIWAGESIGPGVDPDWHIVLVDFLACATGGELAAGDDAVEVGWFRVEEALGLPLTPSMPGLLERLVKTGHLG